MYVYKADYVAALRQTVYTVGYYSPDGEWHPESEYQDKDRAAAQVSYLNGGEKPVAPE